MQPFSEIEERARLIRAIDILLAFVEVEQRRERERARRWLDQQLADDDDEEIDTPSDVHRDWLRAAS